MALRLVPAEMSTPASAARLNPIIQLHRATATDRTPLRRASSGSSTTERMWAPSRVPNSRNRSPKATATAMTTWAMRS